MGGTGIDEIERHNTRFYKNNEINTTIRKVNESIIPVRAFKIFGKDNQVLQTIEELNELSQVLLQSRRKDRVIDNKKILEEIADVEIMLVQMKLAFDEDMEFDSIKSEKLDKLDKNTTEKERKDLHKILVNKISTEGI